MKTILSSQQTSFFTNNGFIEFEIPHPSPPSSLERDVWRKEEEIKRFILRKLAPIALALTGKKQLRLALDQRIEEENRPRNLSTLKEMFSIQGLVLGASLAPNPVLPSRKSSLGILPFPSDPAHVLFFKPDLILDWPHTSSELFLILFSLPDSVYIYNPKDPSPYFLKSLGYHFGDVLKNETHPLIFL